MTRRLALPILFASLVGFAACGDDGGGRAETAEEGSEFCDISAEIDEVGDEVNAAFGDPQELEDRVGEALDLSRESVEAAPEDILEVVEINLEAQEAVAELLEDYDWDAEAALTSEEGQELVANEEWTENGEELDEYVAEQCGIEDDDDVVGGDEPVSTDEPDTTDTAGEDPDVTMPEVPAGADVDLPDGEAGYRRFVELYAIGSQSEVTPEQEDCLVDEMSGSVSVEQLEAVLGGAVDEDAQIAVGLAFIACGVIEG